MDLKFYLNKFLKIDSIENYSLRQLIDLRKRYESFLDRSNGLDPDFPGLNFGGNQGKGEKIRGVSMAKVDEEERKRKEAEENRFGNTPTDNLTF